MGSQYSNLTGANDEDPPGIGGTGTVPPSVTCECCGFSINTKGVAPNAPLVQCADCLQHMAIGPPPPGKKYVRCTCKKLLHCDVTATSVRCPACNTVLSHSTYGTVALPQTTAVSVSVAVSTVCHGIRIICAHCNNVMLCATTGIVLCPHCKLRSCLGRETARCRAISFFVMAFIFFGIATGATVGTAVNNPQAAYYAICSVLYVFGLIWLFFGIVYALIRVSYPEGHTQARPGPDTEVTQK